MKIYVGIPDKKIIIKNNNKCLLMNLQEILKNYQDFLTKFRQEIDAAIATSKTIMATGIKETIASLQISPSEFDAASANAALTAVATHPIKAKAL